MDFLFDISLDFLRELSSRVGYRSDLLRLGPAEVPGHPKVLLDPAFSF